MNASTFHDRPIEGDPTPAEAPACPTCGGEGRTPCPACHGSGWSAKLVPCGVCHRMGTRAHPQPGIGYAWCPDCN